MNSVAIEALIKLDRQRGTDRHTKLVRTVAERIVSMQVREGPAEGSLPYSDLEPHLHMPLYTALALRGLPGLAEVTGETVWAQVASRAVAFVNRLEDAETGLWCHKLDRGRLARFPLFVSGAGIICNGILDAAQLTGAELDGRELAGRLLRFQQPNGAIRNFVGYDHADNGRKRGTGIECWEDVFPTPNWNAQAFHFLSRVLPPPEPTVAPNSRRTLMWSRRYVYFESNRVSAVIGMRPASYGVIGLFVKRLRHGVVVPAPRSVANAVARKLPRLPPGRG
jgi:hypothetical protein